VVSFPDARHARPHVDDYAGAFMAQDGREQTFRIAAGKREVVGVTDAGGFHLDKDFAGFRPFELHVQDRQRLAFFECNGGVRFHSDFLATESVTLYRDDTAFLDCEREPPLLECERLVAE
jgi:hypothetical protein